MPPGTLANELVPAGGSTRRIQSIGVVITFLKITYALCIVCSHYSGITTTSASDRQAHDTRVVLYYLELNGGEDDSWCEG